MNTLKAPFDLFFVADETNGVLEIHHNHEIASNALAIFKEEGEEINIENGQSPEKANKNANEFFSMEHARIESLSDLLKILEDMGNIVGQFRLSILDYCVENGLVDEQQSSELYNEIN